MANPVFSRNPIFSAKAAQRAQAAPPVPTAGQLAEQYAVPSPSQDEMGRMTYEDTIVKTAISFGVLVVGAVIGWALGAYLIVTIGAALIGFVLAMVNTFKREPVPALVLAHAFFEGIFVGGISMVYSLLVTGNGAIVPWQCSAPSASSASPSPSSRAAKCAPRSARPRSSSSRSSGMPRSRW